MQKTFAQYGSIQEIRVFKDKGYAFVRSVMPAFTRIISISYPWFKHSLFPEKMD